MKQKQCPECDGEGGFDVYPPYSIDAFDGAGNAICHCITCPLCKGNQTLPGKMRRFKPLVRRFYSV